MPPCAVTPKSARMTRKLPEAKRLSRDLPRAQLAESPYWRAVEQALYWVDIEGCLLHRFHAPSGHQAYPMSSKTGFVVAAQDGRLALGLADGIYLFDRQTGDLALLAAPAHWPAGNRFNDGKCDPRGNLWAGTISQSRKAEAALYYLHDGLLHVREQYIVNSNGLGWSPDGRTMYFNDTAAHTTWAYDYDVATAAASAKCVFADHGAKGRPDGLCVDTAGRVYCASWSEGAVDVFSPEGMRLFRIEVPVDHVTSCAFGGADMKRLFITTAGEKGESGHLFYYDADIAGLPETPLRL